MKRLAFNGGEVSPAMALRSDMDVYARSCSRLENWDLSPTGGISRRRGMRSVAEAMAGESILIPFVYSEDECYLVELGREELVVRPAKRPDSVVARFSGVKTVEGVRVSEWGYSDLQEVSWQQINSVLLICAPRCELMRLKLDGGGVWSFSPFSFKCPPWYTVGLRDSTVTVEREGGVYRVSPEEGEADWDDEPDAGELLRVSYYTPRMEAGARMADVLADVDDGGWVFRTSGDGSPLLEAGMDFAVGDRLAVMDGFRYECFICTEDWDGSRDLTAGFTSPANYKDNFERADDMGLFEEVAPVYELTAGSRFSRGDAVKVASGYWELYTCIKAWSGADYRALKTRPGDYPLHFVRGVALGEALPCKGSWKFRCSGVWYGSYEVRRTYGRPAVSSMWESVGESFSPISNAQNNLLAGDEGGEECWLQLYLTCVRYKGADIMSGWPPDTCDNRLVVGSYKHDMLLRATEDGFFEDVSPVPVGLAAPLVSDDWSWGAFNSRYGYPALAALHESRLVLGCTLMQPQTIWMSRTDDLDNFDTGGGDDAALHLTMATTTQAAICWMVSYADNLMLGTEDGEWVLNSGRQGALTAGNARLQRHGFIGSAHIPAVRALDKVLYCERGSGRVYQYGYSYESDAYISTDMTVFADHIAMDGGGITGGAVLRKPYCVAVFVLADGSLALMSYNTLHNVNAWHHYSTQGRVESVAALCDRVRRDKLFLITERAGKRLLEVIDADSKYVDAGTLDYVSTVETTAFTVQDADERKVPQAKLQVYLQQPVPAANIVARTGNTGYAKLNHTGNLPAGWTDIVTLAGWTDRPLVGLQVKGNVECTVLAMQAG